MTYTLPSNITDLPTLLSETNTLVGNDMLGLMLMFVVFFITLSITSSRYELSKSMVFSLWITTITTFLLTAIMGMSAQYTILPIIALAVSVIITKND